MHIYMAAGSKSGRVVKPIHEMISPFRWMGVVCAVYAYDCPSESGMKVRKNPCPRGRNRRGRRSARGGRKRRALVSDALETSKPTASKERSVSTAWSKRATRREEYSRTLINLFKGLIKERLKVKEKLRQFPGNWQMDVDNWDARRIGLNRTLRQLRRSWITLSKSSGNSHEFALLTHRLLVQGLDDFHSSQMRRVPFSFRRKLEIDWLGELVPEPVAIPAEPERPPAKYHCSTCDRDTNSAFCRWCGGSLTNSRRVRQRRRGGGYTGNQIPRGDGRALTVGVFDGPANWYVPGQVSESNSSEHLLSSAPSKGRRSKRRSKT